MASLSQAYRNFQVQLQDFADRSVSDDFSAPQGIQDGQQLLALWQRDLADFVGENLADQHFSQWRSLHTELHRELRLLNVDLMFLRSCRTAETQQNKRQTIGDRLKKMSTYCEQILTILNANP